MCFDAGRFLAPGNTTKLQRIAVIGKVGKIKYRLLCLCSSGDFYIKLGPFLS